MNPTPISNFVSTPTHARPDIHSLRYEFRHLVNAGLVSVARWDDFVAWVDRQGGLRNALARISGPIDLAA